MNDPDLENPNPLIGPLGDSLGILESLFEPDSFRAPGFGRFGAVAGAIGSERLPVGGGLVRLFCKWSKYLNENSHS